jgi:hypothetical protein
LIWIFCREQNIATSRLVGWDESPLLPGVAHGCVIHVGCITTTDTLNTLGHHHLLAATWKNPPFFCLFFVEKLHFSADTIA